MTDHPAYWYEADRYIDYKFIVDMWLWNRGLNSTSGVLQQLALKRDDEIALEIWEAWGHDDWDMAELLSAVASVRRSYE